MKKFLLKKQTVIVLSLSLLLAVMYTDAVKAQTMVEIDGVVYGLVSKYAMVFPKDLEYNEELQTDISSYSGDINIPSTVSYNDKDYTVNTIYFEAFKGSSITSITLPNTIEEILKDAFVGCTNLRSITLPASVESLDDNETNIFAYCSSLQEINVDPANKKYASQDGVLYNKAMTILRVFPGGRETFSNFPETVQRIGSEAFAGGSIRSINIPATITSIISDAFIDCKNLVELTIPETITKIPDGFLDGCSSIRYVKVPEGVLTIGEYAFWGCSSLETLDLPSTLYTNGYNSHYAFWGSSIGSGNLKNVICRCNFPPSIEIGSRAFWMYDGPDGSKIENLYIPSQSIDYYMDIDQNEESKWWEYWALGFKNYLPLEDYEEPDTGVFSIKESNNNQIEVYNLNGVLVMRTNDKSAISHLPKGLYIIDGKKFLVK